MRCVSAFSGFKFRKSSTQRTQRITENHREIGPSFSVVNYSPSPGSPPCSLWLFSVFSVLNSEKRNTEDTKFPREGHREIGLPFSVVYNLSVQERISFRAVSVSMRSR